MYLLDTSILIWWLEGNARLPLKIRGLIAEHSENIFVSAVSVWEIAIKSSLHKLKIPKSFFDDLNKSQFHELPIVFSHAKTVHALPYLHDDPFDRLLIAQAQVEGLTIITTDTAIMKYDVTCIQA